MSETREIACVEVEVEGMAMLSLGTSGCDEGHAIPTTDARWLIGADLL